LYQISVHLLQIGLNEKLEQTWGRLCRALSENEAKLNVTEAFNTTIIEVNHRIEELGLKVNDVRDSQLSPERICSVERRRLNNDIQELRHIADMLIAQVNANHNVTPEARQTAIASIRRKVDGVDSAHRRMESMFMEAASSSRSQSTHRLSIDQQSPSEDLSRPYYHIAGMARRPSGQSLPPGTAQPIGSIRLSDTESYL
ncbi:hypothetical protein COOONC_11581, partial [Cooperia oncophora]